MRRPYEYYGQCSRVIDGDTIEVVLDLGMYISHTIRVRLLNVDAAEINSGSAEDRERGINAKNITSEWLFNKPVKLITVKDSTTFNRYLGVVYVDDPNFSSLINVNEILMKTFIENNLTR